MDTSLTQILLDAGLTKDTIRHIWPDALLPGQTTAKAGNETELDVASWLSRPNHGGLKAWLAVSALFITWEANPPSLKLAP